MSENTIHFLLGALALFWPVILFAIYDPVLRRRKPKPSPTEKTENHDLTITQRKLQTLKKNASVKSGNTF